MIVSFVELPEKLGGKIQVLFVTKGQKKNFRTFLKYVPTNATMDGEEL